MARPASLSVIPVRRGEATPTAPEEATGIVQEAQKMVEALAERETSTSVISRAPSKQKQLEQVNARLPVEVAEALRYMAFIERRPVQQILTEFAEEGLKRWRADWRNLV